MYIKNCQPNFNEKLGFQINNIWTPLLTPAKPRSHPRRTLLFKYFNVIEEYTLSRLTVGEADKITDEFCE